VGGEDESEEEEESNALHIVYKLWQTVSTLLDQVTAS
jgi:hypothetical protein